MTRNRKCLCRKSELLESPTTCAAPTQALKSLASHYRTRKCQQRHPRSSTQQGNNNHHPITLDAKVTYTWYVFNWNWKRLLLNSNDELLLTFVGNRITFRNAIFQQKWGSGDSHKMAESNACSATFFLSDLLMPMIILQTWYVTWEFHTFWPACLLVCASLCIKCLLATEWTVGWDLQDTGVRTYVRRI